MTAEKWQDWMNSGVPEIDKEHREILLRLNLLEDAIVLDDKRSARMLLDSLIGCLAQHFLHEERFLRNAGYELTDDHARHHDETLAFVRRMSMQMIEGSDNIGGMVEEIRSFFLDTLIREDLAYRRVLRLVADNAAN